MECRRYEGECLSIDYTLLASHTSDGATTILRSIPLLNKNK